MKNISRLLLYFGLVLGSSPIAGQESLFNHADKYPPYESIAEELSSKYLELSRQYRNQGDLEKMQTTIEVYNELNIYHSSINKAYYENQKGIIAYYRNNNNSALHYYLNALYHFNNAGSGDGINLIMNNIAIIFAEIDDLESSRKYLAKALEYTPAEDINVRSIFMFNLAETESRIGNCESGLSIANDLLEIYDSTIIDFSEVAVYGIIIGCYNEMEIVNSSKEWIEKGIKKITEETSYLDILSFYTEVIEYYFNLKEFGKVIEVGRHIYPPPDTTFMRDMDESINYMAISARKTGLFNFARELDRIANRLEFSKTNVNREDLITPLMVEYSFSRDNNDRDLLYKELLENNKRERVQRKFLISLIFIIIAMIILTILLQRTWRIRNKFKSDSSLSNDKLERINSQLNSNNIELEKENKLLDTLISVFAHDLINPFQAILGFSQLMISDHDVLKDEDFIEYSELLSETSFQLNELLINLKSLSIVQDQTKKLESTDIKLRPIIKNVLKLFEPSARKKRIEFKNESNNTIYGYINRDIFESVFRNIISNAVKFSNHGKPIEIRTIQKEKETEIHIKDYGIGMPEEIRRNLLERHYLESRTGTSNEKGSGIGLAISIELLELINGSIDIVSNVNQGTTVILKIPNADE